MAAERTVIQLGTRCASTEEFIERFARFTTETDVVVPALPHLRVGSEGPFVIRLKDRTVVMKGRGEVTEIRQIAGAAGPAGALMRLHLREMDAHSAGIHLRLMERRASLPQQPAMPASASAPATSLPPPSGSHPPATALPPSIPGASAAVPADSPGAVASAVPVADARPQDTETTVVSEQRPEARVPGAAFTLPANPLGDLDAADLATFIEAQLAPGTPWELRLDRARRITRRAAPYAACLLGGILVGAALRSLGAPAAAPPPAELPAPPAPVPVEEVRAPAPRDCVARVTTRPRGAEVVWGDIALGSSPLDHVAIPCGSATVTLRREHFADVTRTITSARETPTVVVERLQRPAAKVVVTSSPPHAIIKVNKRHIGQAPSTIDAQRFQRVRIEASLRGYRPWRKTLYLQDEESQIDVRLVRARRSIARAETPPSSAGAVGPLASR